MKLRDVLSNINYELIKGSLDIEIKDIAYDSRKIEPSFAFVAMEGSDVDGHNFINAAINNGANCIFVSKNVQISEEVTVIKLDDTRLSLALLSANLFENPGEKLVKIAITGTKGKTSTAWIIKRVLEEAGHKVGVIGTMGTYIDGVHYEHKNTTPESYLIQKFMKQMVDSNTKYLVMEVSSQALKVGRVWNIVFDYAIWTNLSIDHIGGKEHPDYEDYVYCKSLLFKQSLVGIFNKDDQEYPNMIKEATSEILTYGQNESDLNVCDIEYLNDKENLGMKFTTRGITNNQFIVNIPGDFSVYNALPVIILSKLLGIDDNTIKKGLKNIEVAGRCEIIKVKNFNVIIDYAHNKLSMESIIKTMRHYKPNRIITVFGCGGGRSYFRKHELGITSGALSDLSIVTSDNPREDEFEDITKDIVKGIEEQNGKYIVIKDREEAIKYAVENAQENDIILLLGKGHEKYQEIKGIRYPFDERKIVESLEN